jgi:hypothetical protein
LPRDISKLLTDVGIVGGFGLSAKARGFPAISLNASLPKVQCQPSPQRWTQTRSPNLRFLPVVICGNTSEGGRQLGTRRQL